MSLITDVLLIINYSDNAESEHIEQLNQYLKTQGHIALERQDINGGEKIFTGTLYLGSFNCFSKHLFIAYAKSLLPTHYAFQILMRFEDSYKFTVEYERCLNYS